MVQYVPVVYMCQMTGLVENNDLTEQPDQVGLVVPMLEIAEIFDSLASC